MIAMTVRVLDEQQRTEQLKRLPTDQHAPQSAAPPE